MVHLMHENRTAKEQLHSIIYTVPYNLVCLMAQKIWLFYETMRWYF